RRVAGAAAPQLRHLRPRPQSLRMTMAGWRYHNPVDVHFGAGAIEALPGLVGARTATLVTFPEAKALGLTARLQQLLGPSLVQVIDRTEPNPDVASLRALYRSFWAEADG